MEKNKNKKILVEIEIKYGPSFQYYLTDSYQKFNEFFFTKGYPLSNGELYYLNSNYQKIVIKSKNDFIYLLRYARNTPYTIKLFYEKEYIDSYINDFEFIDIRNVYSDLDVDESIIDLPIEKNNYIFNNLNAINEIDDDIDKGALNQGIKIITNFFTKKFFYKLNKKIDFNKPKNKFPKLEYKIPSIESLLNNFKLDLFSNKNDINNNNSLDKLSSYFEKIDNNLNNNFIFQTMINSSKITKIKIDKTNLDNNSKINKHNNNKVLQTEIIQSPIIEQFGIECKNCHIKPIKNKRYKCPKCLNYNLCEKCEEKNYFNSFHPHKEFIQIRINKNNLLDNPYSYQCLTRNLIFDIKKENIKNNEIIIDNILLKNNFILPWPGNDTVLKCDKELSTIFCEKIQLPNLVLGQTVNAKFIFKKVKKMPKGEYKCITNFIINGEKYGEPLELFINIV